MFRISPASIDREVTSGHPKTEPQSFVRRPRASSQLCLRSVVALAFLLPVPGLAKGKGLPSSNERLAYCATQLADCIANVGSVCSDTYDKAEHIGSCISAETAECNRRFGKSSRCLTSPMVGPGSSISTKSNALGGIRSGKASGSRSNAPNLQLNAAEPEEEPLQAMPAPPKTRRGRLDATKLPTGNRPPASTTPMATPNRKLQRPAPKALRLRSNSGRPSAAMPGARFEAKTKPTSAKPSPSLQGTLSGQEPELGGTLSSGYTGSVNPAGASGNLPKAGNVAGGLVDGGDPTVRGNPPTVAKLWVDDRFDSTALVPGRLADIEWDVTGVPGADGIALFVSSQSLAPGRCDSLNLSNLPGPGLPGSRLQQGTTGHIGFDLDPMALGTTLRFLVCPVAMTGPPVMAGSGSNVVEALFDGAPDLVVSQLRLAGDELRYKIRNVGIFPKKVAELKYSVSQRVDGSTRTHYGVAAWVSLEELAPGQESVENRVLNLGFSVDGSVPLRVCINNTRSVVETSYENNCSEFRGADVLPDLSVRSLSLLLHQDNEGFCIGIATCLLRSSENDIMDIIIGNSGGVRASQFKLKAQVWAGSILVFEREIPAGPLEPGGTESHEFLVYERADNQQSLADQLVDQGVSGCCTIKAIVDPTGHVPETDESNNERAANSTIE